MGCSSSKTTPTFRSTTQLKDNSNTSCNGSSPNGTHVGNDSTALPGGRDNEYEDVEEKFKEWKSRLPKLSDNFNLSDDAKDNNVTNLSTCMSWYNNDENGNDFGRYLTSLKFTELFQKVTRENFDHLFDDESGNFPIIWANYEVMVLAVWNMSYRSEHFCERIVAINLHSDIFKHLDSNNLKPTRTNETIPRFLMMAFLCILSNTVRKVSEAKECFRKAGGVDILSKFKDNADKSISFSALLLQSYIVTEEENEKINSNSTMFKQSVRILKHTINGEACDGLQWNLLDIIQDINSLAKNDANKIRIVEAGALPLYTKLLDPGFGVKVQAAAARGLWSLSFKCGNEIRRQVGCIEDSLAYLGRGHPVMIPFWSENDSDSYIQIRLLLNQHSGLKSLVGSTDPDVSEQAKGALWILDEQTKPVADGPSETTDDAGHVFISYQWDSKPIILEIRNRLKSAGFRTWIDEDDMTGSILEAMANAVENAAVVVICLSQKYKDSPNCRTEAEYTFTKRKKVIPLLLQQGYRPDGWLGAIVTNKLFFNFSRKDIFESSFKGFTKELEKQTLDLVAVPNKDSITRSNQVGSGANSVNGQIHAVKSWTKNDIEKWIEKKQNLQHLRKWFLSFNDGIVLSELIKIKENAPDSFFAYLMKESLPLKDAAAISIALDELH